MDKTAVTQIPARGATVQWSSESKQVSQAVCWECLFALRGMPTPACGANKGASVGPSWGA